MIKLNSILFSLGELGEIDYDGYIELIYWWREIKVLRERRVRTWDMTHDNYLSWLLGDFMKRTNAPLKVNLYLSKFQSTAAENV